MAIATECQTDGAVYSIHISDERVEAAVRLPFPLNLSKEQAVLLEKNLHNAVELVLAPHFLRNKMRGSGE